MMQDKALALTYTQIGGLTSILPVCYGIALLPCVSHNAYTLLSTGQKLLMLIKSMLGMQTQRSLRSYQWTSAHLQQHRRTWLCIQDIQAEVFVLKMSWKQPSSDLPTDSMMAACQNLAFATAL